MNKPNELSGGIFSAFVRAQKAFGPALKTSNNPHFKSKYADLSACVEAVIDALNAEGIAMIQKTHECSDGVAIETVFLHSSGESISSGVLRVPAVKQDAQGYGSAMTYARRYSLMAACGIAPEDDDGNAASKPGKAKKEPSPAITPTADAWERVSEEERAFLTDIAMDAIAMIAGGNVLDAVKHIQAQKLDADETVALWTRFDSKQRSAMKKAKAEMDQEEIINTP